MTTITERDILNVNPLFTNVSTSSTASKISYAYAEDWPTEPPTLSGEYFISARNIMVLDAPAQPEGIASEPREMSVSPTWLRRVKDRIKELTRLPEDWDSYGAMPVDPRIASLAEDLIEWFAVADMPPPDVFATPDGGMQIEWHIRRVNAEIELSPSEETTIRFHDLTAGDPWSRPASAGDLQSVRRRLLTIP